jgi:3-phenylpropionate/cinnamic acid dioxygenase small subunit
MVQVRLSSVRTKEAIFLIQLLTSGVNVIRAPFNFQMYDVRRRRTKNRSFLTLTSNKIDFFIFSLIFTSCQASGALF